MQKRCAGPSVCKRTAANSAGSDWMKAPASHAAAGGQDGNARIVEDSPQPSPFVSSAVLACSKSLFLISRATPAASGERACAAAAASKSRMSPRCAQTSRLALLVLTQFVCDHHR